MWSGATSSWLAALTASHRVTVRAEVWFAGQFAGALPVAAGLVAVTARNRVRRSLSMTVPESYWPLSSTDLLAPYGADLKVFRGIVGAAGEVVGGLLAPVFAGRVESVSRDRKSGLVTVTGLDPFADINDAQFESPRAPSTGSPITSAIVGLIEEIHPEAVVGDFTGSGATTPAGILWDTDRGQAIDDLAASIGAEVFCQPDGLTWIIRLVPTLTGLPVWSIGTGAGGVVVRDVQSRARTDVANRWIVHVERPGLSPLLVPVSDLSPVSATRYGGPYGPVVRHMSSPLITDASQATQAGQARIARSAGLQRTRDVDTPVNPALEAGDLLAITTDDGRELHIADAFAVGLSAADPMTINTRSTLTP